ncbi:MULTISPECIES: DUF6707 family protein [Crystallibacter]|uniref:DUF6707 family protein n=1 Tax=Crystallibacter TaxID=3456524 RepID=UPI0014746D82|nr:MULTISPECIES: DUF6707 family protein [unclassified Arthrobacter]MCW2133140.1 hypothetical protein [Arthrobacter sp. VKM Ac-2550]NMR29268.1 hypothetical protein [Arthrobacter sp. SF27]
MTEQQPQTYVHNVKAEAVEPGHMFLRRRGKQSAAVVSSAVEKDDFGSPALVIAKLADGTQVRIAHGSSIRVASTRPFQKAPTVLTNSDLELIPAEEGTPEAVIVGTARAHPKDIRVQRLAARLSKGLNTKAGSNLQDVRDLAHRLFVDLADEDNALNVCRLVTDLPFDGNFGRWKWIQSTLAIAAYITHEAGDIDESQRLGDAMRAPDEAEEEDPLRAKMNAVVRQRQLNEPNLYDSEIHRAMASGDQSAEHEWRVERLSTLMYLRTHGGSETLEPAELDRRIANELVAIRALNGKLTAP